MILSIRTKLFFAIFLACLLSIGGLAGIIQFKFKRSFLDYLNEQESRSLSQLETQLIELYESSGDWKELERNPRLWSSLLHSALRSSLYPSNGEDQDEVNPPPPPFPPLDRELGGLPPPRSHIGQRIDRFVGRIVLLDAERKIIKGIDRLGIPDNLHELKSKGKLIGYIGMHRRQRLTEKVDVEFSDRLQRSLWLIGLLVLPITGILAFLLARHLGKPIQALRSGARLQQNEVSRKQWIADIAHELRTPLAILRGEVEALQDGINQPDANTFASLHQEVSHLQRLVDDLYDLSMSDSGALSYRMETLDVIALLRETLTLHSNQLHEQNLQIDTLGISPESVKVQGDPQRLQQLFKNLLENSLRYTDKPGQLRITTERTTAGIDIIFNDSPPGVPDESLSHLFDRLYRVEASRNRATGGAGIGLSICRNIADAHDGSITAAHSALGGLEIRIHLPVANGKPA